jgi:hypothetical protein
MRRGVGDAPLPNGVPWVWEVGQTAVVVCPLTRYDLNMDDKAVNKWRGPDRKTWYIVAHATDLASAEIPAGLLRGANIPLVLIREAASSAIPLSVGLLGGVDIAVPEAYYEEAQALLDPDRDDDLDELPPGEEQG